MNSKFKKSACVLLAASLLVSVFSGCAGKKEDKAKDQSAAQTSAPKAPVVIEWYAHSTDAAPDMNSEVMQEVQKKFNAKINVWTVDSQKGTEIINVKLAAGEMPDILRLKGFDLSKLVEMGVAREVPKETILSKAPGYAKLIEKYDTDKVMFMGSTYKGKNYGFCGFNLNGTYPVNLVWRLDWLKNVGINKVPSTLTEFEEAVYKFTKNDPDKNGKNDTYGLSNLAVQAVFGAYGYIPTDILKATTPYPNISKSVRDGKIVFNPIQPEMKEALALLQKWYKDGVIDPEFITGENKGGYWATSHAFINGTIGVQVM